VRIGELEGHLVPHRQVLPPCEDQPALAMSVHMEEVQSDLPIPTVELKYKGKWSLASSTHKLGKTGPKWQRTVTVHGLHVSQAPPSESEQLCNLSEPTYTYPSTSTIHFKNSRKAQMRRVKGLA